MKPIYIFDLDGTLAIIDHRIHHIKAPPCPNCEGDANYPGAGCTVCADTGRHPTFKPNWKAFFAACVDDEPNWPVIHALKALRSGGAEIWVWTGRSDEVAAETEEWLHRHGIFRSVPFLSWEPLRVPEMLRMRKSGDHRADDVLKGEWLSEVEPPEYKRLCGAFEDRTRVVNMWRKAGIPCFQVAEGDF